LTYGKKVEEMPHPYEDSCGAVSHVNEDDENLNTSTAEEKYQRRFMIIGGIEIFLPRSQGEDIIFVLEIEEKG
jgi:hypothetical protein